jgi:hypothetical protein
MGEGGSMDAIGEFNEQVREATQAFEANLFRAGLLEAVRARASESGDEDDLDFAFVCEVGSRMADAEEFSDFIPCHFDGTGLRGRKIRVDGYEADDADESLRLLITDFKGAPETETITKSRVEAVFTQLQSFIEESAAGKIGISTKGDAKQARELSSLIEQRHSVSANGVRAVSRYRLYLLTDSSLSERLRELVPSELDGIPIEFHIWDINRLRSISTSILGAEELEIDFTEFVDGGLPCLLAGRTEDYDGYLCVIPGETLTAIYDRYGSRLLEGNVRSFLSTTGKINKGIQATIRKESGRFFVYNNGISATATSVRVEHTESGPRILSTKYLQIVNGGQTTASLHVAKRKDNADLAEIYVQMKLTVVNSKDPETLDGLIQKIAMFSNKQNKVSDVDFFSNHAFHRAIEGRSRTVKAPAANGFQFNTFWFYERARGQYFNEQSKKTLAQKKAFQRENPRSQLVTKTDLAKYENSWRKLPHIVSRHAQRNFLEFADYVGKQYGEDGRRFDNDVYFKTVISHAILFKFTERLVSQARTTWYPGDYRAQIVTYTLAKFVDLLEQQAPRSALDLRAVWNLQGVSQALSAQLETIAKLVSESITTPPPGSKNVGEWCKKEECWDVVRALPVSLNTDLREELIPIEQVIEDGKTGRNQGAEDAKINTVVLVHKLRESGCWARLAEWGNKYSPIYGKEADLLRNASQPAWIPSDAQAKVLIKLLDRLESEGFKREE